MKLRLNLALTNFRQVEITVRDDLQPGELQRLASAFVHATHGHQDVVVVQCVEEILELEEVGPCAT